MDDEMSSDFCLDKERLMNSFMEEFNQNIQNNDISNDNIFKYTLLIGIRKYFRDFDSTNSTLLQEQYLEKLQNTVDIFTSVYEELMIINMKNIYKIYATNIKNLQLKTIKNLAKY